MKLFFSATLADLQVQEAEAESARLQAAQEAAALAGGESSQPGADTPAKPPPKDEKPPKVVTYEKLFLLIQI